MNDEIRNRVLFRYSEKITEELEDLVPALISSEMSSELALEVEGLLQSEPEDLLGSLKELIELADQNIDNLIPDIVYEIHSLLEETFKPFHPTYHADNEEEEVLINDNDKLG